MLIDLKKWWHLSVLQHHILRRVPCDHTPKTWVVTCSCYSKWLAPKEF